MVIERKTSGINGLKGLAIIGVFLYHISSDVFSGGFLGVILFFTISGYLITQSTLLADKDGKFSLLNFYKKRIFRLYPALITVLVISIILLFFIKSETVSGKFGEVLSILFGYNNWWQISKNLSYFEKFGNSSPFMHFWYVGVILQFYLIWPFMYFIYKYLLKKYNLLISLIPILLCILISGILMATHYIFGADVSRIYYGTDTRLFSILMGCVLALYRWKIPANKVSIETKKLIIIFFSMVFAYLLLLLYANGESFLMYCGGMFLVSLAVTYFIDIISNKIMFIGDWIDSGILDYLGTRSYYIYLIHFLIIFICNCLRIERGIIFIIVNVLISILFSEIFYRFNGIKLFVVMKKLNKKVRLVLLSLVALSLIFSFIVLFVLKDKRLEVKNNLESMLSKNDEFLRKKQEEVVKEIEKNKNKPLTVTAVGDSILLGVSPYLQEKLPQIYIDAKVSRQLYHGVDIIKELKKDNKLGNNVILVLGTNGYFTESQGQELIDEIGKERKIYWVNCYTQEDIDTDKINSVINDLSKKNNNLFVIDWSSLVKNNTNWLYGDGTHIHPDYQDKFVDPILDMINKVNNKKD